MQEQELSVPCEGLLFRVFQQPKNNNYSGASVVALTSPHPGAGVSQITSVLAEALRRDGDQSVISLSADELSCGEAGQSSQINLSNALEEIRHKYRYVLIDCGPLRTHNAIRLAPLVDGVILVLEANRTQTEQIRYAERTIESVNGRILGHVLNKRTYVIPNWFHRMMDAVGI
jgi:Mrp family chromosome partitioning ATPase